MERCYNHIIGEAPAPATPSTPGTQTSPSGDRTPRTPNSPQSRPTTRGFSRSNSRNRMNSPALPRKTSAPVRMATMISSEQDLSSFALSKSNSNSELEKLKMPPPSSPYVL